MENEQLKNNPSDSSNYSKIRELSEEINKLEYADKKKLHDLSFSIGYIEGNSVEQTLVLISLLCLTYLKLKEQNPKITPFDIIKKIVGPNISSSFSNSLENFSIIIEDLSYGHKSANSCGLKSSDEIINKIKQILNTWTPF
jgi:hypothetical protein